MSEAGQSWARLLRAASDAVSENVDNLTSLDSVVGDGDHGVNLRAGFQDVIERLDADSTMNAQQVLRAAGDGLQESMAGTAGLLLGRFFVVASKAIDDKFDTATVATVLTNGTAEIVKRGGATVGDRSMLDALVPAARVALEHSDDAPLEQLLAAVVTAAQEGAASTKDLVPRVGRAARATQSATGHPDAGATSIALIFEAWAIEQARSGSDV